MRFNRSRLRGALPKLAFAMFLIVDAPSQASVIPAGDRVGAAVSTNTHNGYTLGNHAIQAHLEISGGNLVDLTISDIVHHKSISIPSPLSLLFADGSILRMPDLHFVGTPVFQDLSPIPEASRYSDRLGGKEFKGALEDQAGDMHVDFSIVLRDGSPYLRQVVTLSALKRDLLIKQVRLIDLHTPKPKVMGTVSGSPLVAGDLFFGIEHPLSASNVSGDHVVVDIDRSLPLPKGQPITYSSVIGVAPTGQLRRAFLSYIERERAHPYRTFLHYNSWYDAGYFTPYDESLAVDRINTFGHELHDRRGVTLDSFLFDDGWDNHTSLWGFNSGFPNGFTPIRAAAAKYNAAPGVWLSPWGGYSKPKQERIAFGTRQGFEVVDNGYALSGPRYYDHFRDVCLEMIRKYGINQFKFDGTGNADHVFPGSRFDSDFSAMIHLIGELRREKPDIFVNLTTGTAASPFWLLYADSIWRGGEDHSFAGVGSFRERWITYRDAETYARVVSRGPLYLLNSLMLHGIIYAQFAEHLGDDPGNDFVNEVHSYFGTGTQLQELYITPSLLSSQNWDTLAESANWSRKYADVLKDSHWVGGDPNWLEVYGWASWSPQQGILVLRNPSDKPASIEIDLTKVLELPSGAPQIYSAKSPWKVDDTQKPLRLKARIPHRFTLAPFEVLTLNLQPVSSATPVVHTN